MNRREFFKKHKEISQLFWCKLMLCYSFRTVNLNFVVPRSHYDIFRETCLSISRREEEKPVHRVLGMH